MYAAYCGMLHGTTQHCSAAQYIQCEQTLTQSN